jgi:hypothetical protein
MRTFLTFAFGLSFILALAHSRKLSQDPDDSLEQLKMAEEYINIKDFQQTEEKPEPGKEYYNIT